MDSSSSLARQRLVRAEEKLAARLQTEKRKVGSGKSCGHSEIAMSVNAIQERPAAAAATGSGANNGLGGQMLRANSGKSSGNNGKSSYSKMFRQYLPASLNLNYTLNNSKSNSSSSIKSKSKSKSDLRQELRANRLGSSQDRQEQQVFGTEYATEPPSPISTKQDSIQSASSRPRSLVSAFTRFKLSSPACAGESNCCRDSFASQERKFSPRKSSESSSLLLFQKDDNNNNIKQTQFSHLDDRKRSSELICDNNNNKVKRKGFLHLKRSRFSGSSANDCSNNSNISISHLLNQHQHDQDHVEHSERLLADEEQEEEEEEEEGAERRARESSRCAQLVDRHSASQMAKVEHEQRRAKKVLLRGDLIKSTKSGRGRFGTLTSKPLTGCLLALGLLALASLGSRLAFGQQQSASPAAAFTRSQPPLPGARSEPNRIDNQHHHHQSAVQPLQQQQPSQQQQQQQQQPSPARQASGGQHAAGSLVANVNCNKIRGHVTLTPSLQGGSIISARISAGPPGEVYQWSVHQFPVKPGAAMCSCSPLILGARLIDLSELHGNLPSDQEFSDQSSLVSLFGLESPVGHSLMLRGMKTGMVACATFLPTSRKSNYRAKFHMPLSGSVTIFQTAFGTSFISHLMYSNGTRRHSMHRFDLVKSDEEPLITSSLASGSLAASAQSAGRADGQAAAIEQREHEHELAQCRRLSNNAEPLFRNLTYQLAVSTENFGMRGRTSLVLPQIPFETFPSVFVIVYSEHDPFEPIACAPLKFVKPKTAAAKFQSVSVQGSVVFSQDSPYDVTLARINLNLPNSDGHSYGIDELPMIIRRKSDTRVCPNIREIIYNPHHVEPASVPPEGEATSDQYAVGDLSGKYGTLKDKLSEKIQVNDFNLPLFGPMSIVGRAMTIYSAEGVAIACSNVELTSPMTTAFATFDYGIQGQFIFRQPVNDCNGDTYVYIEVSKPVSAGGSHQASQSASGANQQQQEALRSLDHNWHIHVNPVDSGLDHLSTTDCTPAGPHYNPYNTSTSSIYSRDCTPFNVLRCELGDLSAKMFTIEIPPYKVKGGQEPDIGKFFGTDIDLPLCGPASVVNRSVVVHVQDFGSQRLACSTVIEFKPRTSQS